MRLEGHAFVPARGGILAVDGRLPSLDDELPPTRLVWTAAHGLHVFEPVDAAGVPPAAVAVPAPLRTSFARCVAELNGARIPERRAAWSRPGFHAAVEAWVGAPLEQVRLWPLSYVARNEDVVFKAVFPHFAHEPAITAALGAPRLVKTDRERGWMLMEALAGGQGADHHAAMRAIARVHRAWASRVDEALALGAHDRRAPSELPHTLIHGDFHAGNVIGDTIIDWSDAAVANPLHDVNNYLLFRDDGERDALIATYAEAWPEHDVARAVAACEAETYEYVAESYRGITDALADDDKWWFADEEAIWLRRASDVRAGRRPSRDR